jgi:hypothetical protein
MANFKCVGKLNHNWKGGKTLHSSGYVLIRVPKGHHMRGVNGYAYEHRVAAENKYGRKLLDGECVHHIDGDKQNNNPDNLVVCKSSAYHSVLHRKVTCKQRRLPDESNPIIKCGCGCGRKFRKYDQWNRPRSFSSNCGVSGEKHPSATITKELADSIRSDRRSIMTIARLYNVSRFVVAYIKHGKTWKWKSVDALPHSG